MTQKYECICARNYELKGEEKREAPIEVRCPFAGGSSSSIDLRSLVVGPSRDDTADGGRVEGREHKLKRSGEFATPWA